MQCVEVSGRLLHDVDDVLCVWWLLCRIDTSYIIIYYNKYILTYLSISHHTCTQSWKCKMIKMELKSVQVSTILHILFAQPLFLFTKTSKSALGFYTLGMGPNLRCFFQMFQTPHVGSSRDPLLQAKTFCEDYNLQFVEAPWVGQVADSYKTSNCWLLLCVGMDFPSSSWTQFFQKSFKKLSRPWPLRVSFTKQHHPLLTAAVRLNRWWGLYLTRWVLS